MSTNERDTSGSGIHNRSFSFSLFQHRWRIGLSASTSPPRPPLYSELEAANRSGLEGSVKLQTDPDSSIKYGYLWAVPTYGCAYTLHRLYRRSCPRRLPPLSPLGLKGLYLTLAVCSTFTFANLLSERDVLLDDDLLTIALSGTRLQVLDPKLKAYLRKSGRSICDDNATGRQANEFLTQIREVKYRSSGTVGHLLWWQHHIWADRPMWNACAVQAIAGYTMLPAALRQDLENEFGNGADLSDWDIFITTLANDCSNWVSAVATNIIIPAYCASTPLAMLARWSGRSKLYRPMNAVQYLLVVAFVWVDNISPFWNSHQLTQLRDRHKFALICQKILNVKSFDEDMKAARAENMWLIDW